MKKALAFLLIITLIQEKVFSQNKKIDKSKFEVFENIKLGLAKKDFEINMKNNHINKSMFFTNMIVGLVKDDQKNIVDYYFSNKFDFDEYKNTKKKIGHPVLIYPESIDNERVTTITLLFGHTNFMSYFNNFDTSSYKGVLQFRQDINKELFNKIINLYGLKYGEPIVNNSANDKEYYMLFKKYIRKDMQKDYYYQIAKWETELFTVEIFPGLDLNAYYNPIQGYSNSTNWLYSNLDKTPLEFHQMPCVSFPYVRYSLNKKGLNLLGITKQNL